MRKGEHLNNPRRREEGRPIRILHLSDLHFGRPVLAEVCDAVRDSAFALEPDAIVVSGDLTQRARPEEFVAARAYLASLPPAELIVVPGNHDVPLYRFWERLASPLKLYDRHIGSLAADRADLEGAHVVGLDSTNPYRAIKGGRIRAAELARCRQEFDGLPDSTWRVVALHHHLVPAPSFDRSGPMPRARRALEALTKMKVDVVLAGHLHRAYVGNSLDVYAGAERESGIIVVQCGTSTSRRGRGLEREANSLNWIEIHEDRLEVTHFMYFGGRAGFSPVSRHEFARPRSVILKDGLDARVVSHREPE